ncbi:MAG: DegV family EDD domain-containing protein [Candidatus Cloacimonetes bacterium]|nr:DegV family EDD domain-containing protein [Candidatus Cloacimonadota bacterium]MCF7814186.1 DegV family EDD domain-containing protein [Candidatus Cloacimonadota bacterium]MCF7868865.1 DegV family EDD domain-containing protein [Candidatus Cloacimonadota bacterium]MCF7884242.1 DegV family EDD domain-containing protein [Candidatus Cloacimonadota bacterium]
MKIKYLDGNRFYVAIKAGSEAVIQNQAYLNKINVFPVPDADTGTNMASTMRSILESSKVYRSLQKTIRSIADSALLGARGNSGIIFAQFIHGLSQELKNHHSISVEIFAQSVNNAIQYVYDSILDPVEGTIITVMHDWAKALEKNSKRSKDFVHLLNDSLNEARKSLQNTPKQLKVLAEAGVVDAGANGFVNFLEGICNFIQKGKLKRISQTEFNTINVESTSEHVYIPGNLQFCTEAILTDSKLTLKELQNELKQFGDSLIAAGSQEKLHLHIHTDRPDNLFEKVAELGNISKIKVDDMQMQYQVSHNRKYPIALVTDSACDLPKDIIEKYQILQIPFNIHFGDTPYLDKLTITADQFYDKLKTDKIHPKSSQPKISTILNLFSFLSVHYKKILAIHISDKLSGAYGMSKQMEKKINDSELKVFNSKQLTVSEGLIVMRAAQAIADGMKFEDLTTQIEDWIEKTDILVDVNTLKYMVRGGRVSPLKGMLATALNLKPIVSLDSDGKATAAGKSFSRKANMKKILQILQKKAENTDIWNYAIVHAQSKERAEQYAEKLTRIIGKEPAYIMELSPVVGVHNGIGAIGIGMMEQ